MSTGIKAHFFWIQGDEYVLINQASRRIFQRYPEASINALRVDQSVNWRTQIGEVSTANLFSAQNLWHIDFFDQIPDAAALEFTRELTLEALDLDSGHSQDPAVVVVYTSAILKSAQRKSKWYAKLAARAGIEIQWPMNRSQALSWARQQLDAYRLSMDETALAYLMDKTETNLSLLDKEMYKLSLLANGGETGKTIHFDIDKLRENIEGDFSRYSPFALATAALLEPIDKFMRMVAYFENEVQDINQLLGALRFSLNQLIELSAVASNGVVPTDRIRHLPRQQKTLIDRCLRHYNGNSLVRALLELAAVEKSARGISSPNPWDALRNWGRLVQRKHART